MAKVWPLKLHPDSNCLPLVVYESLSPPTGYQLPGDRILGIHKVVATPTSDGKLIKDEFAEAVSQHWCDTMRRRAGSAVREMSEARSA